VERLQKRADFLAITAKGKKWGTPAMLVQVWHKADEPSLLYGLTASKKGVGNAVKRNRARRRMREALTLLNKQHSLKPCRMVLVGRRETPTLPFDTLCANLLEALRKLGVTP